MVVGHNTAQKILDVFLRHVDPGEVETILAELRAIRGNRSYRETIDRIESYLRKET